MTTTKPLPRAAKAVPSDTVTAKNEPLDVDASFYDERTCSALQDSEEGGASPWTKRREFDLRRPPTTTATGGPNNQGQIGGLIATLKHSTARRRRRRNATPVNTAYRLTRLIRWHSPQRTSARRRGVRETKIEHQISLYRGRTSLEAHSFTHLPRHEQDSRGTARGREQDSTQYGRRINMASLYMTLFH